MVTRAEVQQGMKARDVVRLDDVALFLDYIDTVAGTTDAAGRANVLDNWTSFDEIHLKDFQRIYEYLDLLGTPVDTLKNWKDCIKFRDIFSRRLINELFDKIDLASFAPPIPPPPFTANLQHHWDLTDSTVVWQDVAGTIPITDGAFINRIDDKGSGVSSGFPPVNLLNQNLNRATWHASPGGGNPLPAGRYLAGPLPGFLSQVAAGGFAGVLGGTWAGVWRVPPGFSATNEIIIWGTGSPQYTIEKVFSNWAEQHNNQGTTQSNKAIVGDEWVWHYVTDGADLGSYRQRVSGSTEVSGIQGYINPGLNDVEMFHDYAEISELLVYDRSFTPGELTTLTGHFVTKYGAIFPP